MEGTIWLSGVCQRWHPFCWLSDWGDNALVVELFNGFPTLNGDLKSCMLNWRDRGVKVDCVHSRHVACSVKWLGECIFEKRLCLAHLLQWYLSHGLAMNGFLWALMLPWWWYWYHGPAMNGLLWAVMLPWACCGLVRCCHGPVMSCFDAGDASGVTSWVSSLLAFS